MGNQKMFPNRQRAGGRRGNGCRRAGRRNSRAWHVRRVSQIGLIVIACAGLALPAEAKKISPEIVLHAFMGGADGNNPNGVVMDRSGNLYGTTVGAEDRDCVKKSCGTIFKLAPDGTYSVLHVFRGYPNGDGASPFAGMVLDAAGNLYGTTSRGGSGNEGSIFKVSADGTETVLFSFNCSNSGCYPSAGVILDSQGNLYGTTTAGGNAANCFNCGAVFELSASGTETVLHSFTDQNGDGGDPEGGLAIDAAGNLYGTTKFGGSLACQEDAGCGIVFKLAPGGAETILHDFQGGNGDGAFPRYGNPILDSSGNLYGMTVEGGTHGDGTVFEVASDGTESTIYSFADSPDGLAPMGNLVMDAGGNLYGTTNSGGVSQRCPVSEGCGTIFRIAPDHTETLLFDFGQHKKAGYSPVDGVIEDGAGNFYGTTANGGYMRNGVVFKFTP
jgi:uncharacterized repeat protein (TIGR03803 family)